MKSVLSSLVLALLLAGCSSEAPAPTPAPAAAPEAAPVATPTPAAVETAAPAPTDSATAAATETPAAAPGEASTPTPTPTPSAETAPAVAPAAAAPAPAPAPPSGPPPQEGSDYTVIDPPAPLAPTPGKIEVVEVFAYTCPHCATLQPRMNAWEKTLPADVEFRYAPMAHGASEQIARAFYAAEAMGERHRTHDGLFTAIVTERRLKTGSAEELADIYADLGIDRDALLATMQSFAVNAQIARNKKAVERWAIEGTPTIIVNGRYRALMTARGHDGLLSTVEHLIARERAAAGTAPAR